MTWVRLDDQFPDHPKVVKAGPLAGWLHVCGIAYCNRHLTDGFIPRGVAHRLTDFNNIGLELGGNEMVAFGDDVSCEWMANVLVDVGLWKRIKDGYKIHDYLDFQPSKAEVEAERKAARERMQSVREKRKRSSGTVRPNTEGTSDYPVPVPTPEERQEGSLLSASRSKTTESLPVKNELQIAKLLAFVGEQEDQAATERTQGTIRGLSRRVSEGSLAKVLESAQLKNGQLENRAAYVVGALKSEIAEREGVRA